MEQSTLVPVAQDPNNIEPAIDTTYKKYIPWFTLSCCLASVVLFVGINFEPDLNSWDTYKKWGAPSSNDIWNGEWWGLVTSNFLHVAIWHIIFNLSWFWLLGKKIEFESTKLFYGLFIFSSAVISSIAQLAFSGETGIGLSGVVYALFGYIFIKAKSTNEYKGFIDKRTINWFLGWLIICIILTYTKVWEVGNAAHIAGLLWGLLYGKISNSNKAIRIGLPILLLSISSITVFWQPWSTAWLGNKAYNLHKSQKLDEAEKVYKIILEREKDSEFARANLRLIQIGRLSQLAFDAHQKYNYEEALKLYKEILKIDPENEWAKENVLRLPIK